MKIAFFGSGRFSLPLVQTIAERFTMCGVIITRPKPHGRGLKIKLPEVAEWAKSKRISVYAPEDPNDAAFLNEISKLKPDLFVLSSYGHILGEQLLRIPAYGGINVHPSLLPQYRGAAPIQRTLMAGETKTGLTIIFMDEIVDHGEVIFQREIDIEPTDTYETLLVRLSALAAEVIVDVIESIEAGTVVRAQQNEGQSTWASKIQKEEMVINWQDTTDKVYNLIRALSPKPGARTTFRAKELHIIAAAPSDKVVQSGTTHIENKVLHIGTRDGSIVVKTVQPANRSVMSGSDFINGFRIKEGEKVG